MPILKNSKRLPLRINVRPNRFADADSITSVVFQLVGAASVTEFWPGEDRVFDELEARDLAEEAMARIDELLETPS